MISLITIWESWNKQDSAWEHNHIEDGWAEGVLPTPKTEEHKKAWKGQWVKHHGYLVGTAIPLRVYTRPEYIRLLVRGRL